MYGSVIRVIKGDTRSIDYNSYGGASKASLGNAKTKFQHVVGP